MKIFRQYKEGLYCCKLLECYSQILNAIKYIHHKGFYHGNINPDNILIDRNNRVYLLDFGKSYFLSQLSNETFAAPEQIDNIASSSQKGDIFSFGLCMLKLLLDNF